MNKKEAKRMFMTYLKERNINYHEHLDTGDTSIYMLLTGYDKCPDKVLECSIFFLDSCMEVRVYFNDNANDWINKRSDELSNIYRLLNYINAMVWSFTHDGIGGELYSPHHLQTPRFYITEEGYFDFTATTVIDYDHFEMAPLETVDYCTAAIPGLMNKLSLPFFFLLMKEISVDDAISLIERDVLNKKSVNVGKSKKNEHYWH